MAAPMILCPLRLGLKSSVFNVLLKRGPVQWRCLYPTLSVSATQSLNQLSAIPTQQPSREMSFFQNQTGKNLWESVTSVSSAGAKKGRGKRVGRKKMTDLNRGQILGTGKANILWPGLNAPVLKGDKVLQRRQLPPNPDYQEQLVKIRDNLSRVRYPKLAPLERGWSGNRFPGQSIGPPEPFGEYTYEGFDSRVLVFKMVANMTGTLGRKVRFKAFVVVGNGNGLAGYGSGKSKNGRTAIRVAKKRAALKLQHIELFDGHTVFHNTFHQTHRSKIFIRKKEKGYGLRCHRALKTICQLIGIKDIHCKVEGSTGNVIAITYGFFKALADQETHQDLSDRLGLHVVEMRKERDYFPVVVASPTSGVTVTEKPIDEKVELDLDFNRLYYDGKVEYLAPKKPSYSTLKSYKLKQMRTHKLRNQQDLHIKRLAGLL